MAYGRRRGWWRDLAGAVRVERGRSVRDVVARGSLAVPGDVILLLRVRELDMFRDYEERGRRFAALARREGADA